MRERSLVFVILIAVGILYLAVRAVASPFGIVVDSFQKGVQEHKAVIQRCADAGAKLIRDEIPWEVVEAEQGKLQIPVSIVQNVQETVSTGIEPILVLSCKNKLYGADESLDSRKKIQAFGRYVEFVARSFKGKVRYLEVLPNPALGAADTTTVVKRYLDILRLAYQAGKKGNRDCKIIGMCGELTDNVFLEGILKEGAGKYMDILSVHIHEQAAVLNIGRIREGMRNLRSLMDKQGMKGKPIWVTELCLSPDGHISVEVKAELLSRSHLELLASGADAILWCRLSEMVDRKDYVRGFGLLEADGRPLPAFFAYKTMAMAISDRKYDRFIWLGENIRAYVFKGKQEEVTALWCLAGVANVTFVGDDEISVVGGAAGKGVTLTPVNSAASITVTESPCYVTRKVEMHPLNILPVGVYQFTPPRATMPPGGTTSIGLQVVNAGKEPLEIKVRILSDQVDPAEQVLTLEPESKRLLTSRLTIPDSLSGDLRLPAEVWAKGKLVARLEMLVRIENMGNKSL